MVLQVKLKVSSAFIITTVPLLLVHIVGVMVLLALGSPSSDPNTSSLRDITSDICPYGWRLPTSTSSGEFQALYTAYSSNYTNFQTALSTPLSGYFGSGKALNQGNNGYFWSSTWDVSANMHLLSVASTFVTPSNSRGRYYGVSVRCVFGS